MKSVLQITTPDEIGLLERASEFISRHNGFIVSDTVRVFGDWAFLLLHFEASESDARSMRSALKDDPPFSEKAHVQLITTNEPDGDQPEPTVLLVWCRDIAGILADQTKLIAAYDYPILAHDGAPVLSGDEVTMEYKQTISLCISDERLANQFVMVGDRRVLRWDKFRSDLQKMIGPLGGRLRVG